MEQGKLTEAQADLDYGMGNTWDRGGMLSSVEGRLALARGDRATALEKYQEAEATIRPEFGPFINRLRREIAALGGAPLVITPQTFVSTPIATPQISATPHATPTSSYWTPVPPTPTIPTPPPATPVSLQSGTGPLILQTHDYPVYQFEPATPIKYKHVKTLTFRLLPAQTSSAQPTLQLYPWYFYGGGWIFIQLQWGDNPVNFPEKYVSPKGEVNVGIRNWGPGAVDIKNAGVRLVVELDDGSLATYGLQP